MSELGFDLTDVRAWWDGLTEKQRERWAQVLTQRLAEHEGHTAILAYVEAHLFADVAEAQVNHAS